MEKSHFIQFVLAFLFGPLGLLYSSAGWPIIMLVVIGIAYVVHPILIIVAWFMSVFVGIGAVADHNANLQLEKEKEKKDEAYKQAILDKLDEISRP